MSEVILDVGRGLYSRFAEAAGTMQVYMAWGRQKYGYQYHLQPRPAFDEVFTASRVIVVGDGVIAGSRELIGSFPSVF